MGDGVTLRQSHFQLGNDPNAYQTTSMAQSDGIENIGPCKTSLDENVKNELRKSHFVIGNFDPEYNTKYRSEYYDKSHMIPKDGIDTKSIERRLRSENYNFGNEKTDYLTEMAAKYTKPVIDPNDKMKHGISTSALQQSHYVFGTQGANWNTTHRASYTPKKADFELQHKNLIGTNFSLGDAEPTLKSVNQEVYVRHPLVSNPLNKELIEDLRSHHFDFGKDNVPMNTINTITYQDPGRVFTAPPKLDSHMLRQSHWTLGDKTQEPPDLYLSTYAKAMTPKKAELGPKKDINTFQSAFSITGPGPMEYITNYRANYIPKEVRKDDLNDMIKQIRNSHFDLGEMQNDYGTTMSNSYQYDPETAKNAMSPLDRELVNDLRATHYKLGDHPLVGQTSHRRDYVPYDVKNLQVAKNPQLRTTNWNLGDMNNNKLEGKTIYMTDYIPKPIPIDTENDCWC
jgi:hypothetical protein